MTDKELKIFNQQPESTKKAMLRHINCEERKDDWPPKGWRAVENAKDYDELVARRSISPEDEALYEGMRRVAGQRLQEIYKDEYLSSVTEIKKEKAIDAFMTPVGEQIKLRFNNIMDDMPKTESYAEMLVRLKNG